MRAAPLLISAALLVLDTGLAAAERLPAKPTFNRNTGLFEPPLTELERSVERGDRAEVARWAERIGPARLAGGLRGSDRSAGPAGGGAAGVGPERGRGGARGGHEPAGLHPPARGHHPPDRIDGPGDGRA